MWRAAAWLLSLSVFLVHFASERRRQRRSLDTATYVALAVGLGALGVPALGPLRAHWTDATRLPLVMLSIVAWPLLTGIPAFVVALLGGFLLDRAAGAPGSRSRVA